MTRLIALTVTLLLSFLAGWLSLLLRHLCFAYKVRRPRLQLTINANKKERE